MAKCTFLLIAFSFLVVSCSPAPSPHDKIINPIPTLTVSAAVDAPGFQASSIRTKSGPMKMLLFDEIDMTHAPFAANDAERFVFKQIFETLTRVDIEGKLQPALAVAWQSSHGGKRWVFTLRQGAVFSDGTPVSAKSVARSWLRAARLDLRLPGPSPFQWLDVMDPGLRVLNNQHLEITVTQAMDDLPLLLANPVLAVVSSTHANQLPLGSGPSRIDQQIHGQSDNLRLLPNSNHPQSPLWQHVDLLIKPHADVPKMLAGDIDFAVLRDKEQIKALSVSRKIRIMELPWDRMHLLVCPPGSSELRQRWNTGWSSRELVREVSCFQSSTLTQLTFAEPRSRICPLFFLSEKPMTWPLFSWPQRIAANDEDLVLFIENDPEAEVLANFLAWHAGRPIRPADDLAGRTPLTNPRRATAGLAPQALGVSPADFAGALQSAQAGAYIVQMNRSWFSSCRQMSALISMATWLQEAALDENTTTKILPEGARAANPHFDFDVPFARQVENRLIRGRTVLPLSISHASVAAKKTFRGFKTDHDGVLDITDVIH